MNKKIKIQKAGFTLIELLIVVAVIAILAALAFVALNPLARFQDARNAQRWADVNALLGAIKLDQVDNGGAYHANIAAMSDNTYYQIGDATTGCDTPACSNPTVSMQSACVDIYGLISEGYIAALPIDSNASGVSDAKTGYYLYKYDSGQISVGSCHEELGSNSSIPTIEVSR
jgi:prepilin-type N-terminal cleavage/methylation domain-containing protein